MGTLHGTSTDPQGALVNGVTLGDPALDDQGKPLWDDHRIPSGDVVAVPTVVKDGKPAPDDKWAPPKDYVISAERKEKPVAIKPAAQLAAVAVDDEPADVKGR